METIKDYFVHFNGFSEEYWRIFSSKLIKRDFNKKSIILKTNQTEKYLSFIEKGIIRYFIFKVSNDVTFDFSFKNEFTSAYDSFLTQQPVKYNVQALTNTILWSIKYEDLQDIYTNTSLGNLLGRIAAENLFLLKTKREIDLLNDTAQERYTKLFTEQPKLIKQIPLKYIASYIGITPQALSRIRKRIY